MFCFAFHLPKSKIKTCKFLKNRKLKFQQNTETNNHLTFIMAERKATESESKIDVVQIDGLVRKPMDISLI